MAALDQPSQSVLLLALAVVPRPRGLPLWGCGSAEPSLLLAEGLCSLTDPTGARVLAAFGTAPSRMERGCRDYLGVGAHRGRLSLLITGLKVAVTRGQVISLAQSPSKGGLWRSSVSPVGPAIPGASGLAASVGASRAAGLIAGGGRAPAAPRCPAAEAQHAQLPG